MRSQWEAAWDSSGGAVGPIEIWMKRTVHSLQLDMSDPDDADIVLLSKPPFHDLQTIRENEILWEPLESGR